MQVWWLVRKFSSPFPSPSLVTVSAAVLTAILCVEVHNTLSHT